MEWSTQNNVLTATLDRKPGCSRIEIKEWAGKRKPVMAVSTIDAGDMTVLERTGMKNRRGLFKRLGISTRTIASLRQIHSKHVHAVEEWEENDYPEGDGLITADPSTILSVTVADCVPVYLFCSSGSVIGILHSGWKGTGIAAEGIDRIRKTYGVSAEDVSAVLGPSIGPCCYSVDRQRGEYFARMWGTDAVDFQDGIPHLDLRTANIRILEKAGVKNIAVVPDCTSCDASLGSYRREGADRFTKMVALIGYFK